MIDETLKKAYELQDDGKQRDAVIQRLAKDAACSGQAELSRDEVALLLSDLLRFPSQKRAANSLLWVSRAAAQRDLRWSLNKICFRDGCWQASCGHVLCMAGALEDEGWKEGLYDPVTNSRQAPKYCEDQRKYPDMSHVFEDPSFVDAAWKKTHLHDCEYSAEDGHWSSRGGQRRDAVRIGEHWYRLDYVRQVQSAPCCPERSIVHWKQDEDGVLLVNVGHEKCWDYRKLGYKAIVMPMRLQ